MADDYTPPTTEAEWKTLATTELTHLTNEEQERLPGDWDVWIARVRRDAARAALDGLRSRELAMIPADADENHPIRVEKQALAWRIEMLIRSDYPKETP